jgi:ankyrin repeat protein
LKNNNGFTPVHVAAEEQNGPALEKLLDALKPHPTILENVLTMQDNDGFTPLHFAVWRNNIPALEKLLNALKDHPTILENVLVLKKNDGNTPLHVAALCADGPTVKKLLDAFKEHPTALENRLTMPNNNGDTPLHVAAAEQNVPALRILLSTLEANSTALNKPGALKELLTTPNKTGDTPLHLAAGLKPGIYPNRIPKQWPDTRSDWRDTQAYEAGRDNVLNVLLKVAFERGILPKDPAKETEENKKLATEIMTIAAQNKIPSQLPYTAEQHFGPWRFLKLKRSIDEFADN